MSQYIITVVRKKQRSDYGSSPLEIREFESDRRATYYNTGPKPVLDLVGWDGLSDETGKSTHDEVAEVSICMYWFPEEFE